MLSSVIEIVGFSFIMGMGGGAYVGGGGAARSPCGIIGGARVGICGGPLVVFTTGFDAFGAGRRCTLRAGGPFRSSGKRKECIVTTAEH